MSSEPFTKDGYYRDPVHQAEAQIQAKTNHAFITKDSGKREAFNSGMVRDTEDNKLQFHRVADGPMLKRWADRLTQGAVKYPDVKPGVPNWTLADGDEELTRFKQSAFRHFMQWFYGEEDEDHAAAVFFNLNGAEYVKSRKAGDGS
jgi:hypothetical protein